MAVSATIARAFRQLGAHDRVCRIVAKSGPAPVRVTIDLALRLPSRWQAAGSSPNGVRTIEQVTAFFPADYPIRPPKFYLRGDFDRSHPHLQPGPSWRPPNPCLYLGDPAELLRGRGLPALIDQLVDWLEKAAAVELIDPVQGWEPVRRDHNDDFVVADPTWLRSLPGKASGCEVFLAGVNAPEGPRKQNCVFVTSHRVPVSFALGNALGSEKAPALAFVAWSGMRPSDQPFVADRYTPETVRDVASLYARAQSLGCRSSLEVKLGELAARTRRPFEKAVACAVLLMARRPCDVIGEASPLEIIPYIIELEGNDDFSDRSTKRVRLASHRDTISPALLRRASGVSAKADTLLWSLLGCGSVGSKVAVHMARLGNPPLSLVDKSVMQPHNFARHALLPLGVNASLMPPKAQFLDLFLHGFGSRTEPLLLDILRRPKEAVPERFPDSLDFALNATGSLTVRECLSAPEVMPNRVRFVETCLFGQGRVAYLSVEGPEMNPSTFDLVVEAFRVMRDDPAIADVTFSSKLQEVQIGQGCSSPTFPMSDARLSAMTAPMAEYIATWQTEGLPEEGCILIGLTPPDGIGQTWLRRSVPRSQIISAAGHARQVRLSEHAHAKILAEIEARPNVETGGVVIGRYSDITDASHVVDVISAPSDSKFSAGEFTLGVGNLRQEIATLVNQTGGALYALGTWHNHLAPSGPSGLDARTAALLAELQLSPVLLLIHTPAGYTFLSAEADAFGGPTAVINAGRRD